jgi:8-oxo-dGTP pyrophosphatase MutT (NUDIX family)
MARKFQSFIKMENCNGILNLVPIEEFVGRVLSLLLMEFIMGISTVKVIWEIPGGHREVGESVKDAGARELFEETGAIGFHMEYICIYSVLKEGQEESFGALFYADVRDLGEFPESEIGEIGFLKRCLKN